MRNLAASARGAYLRYWRYGPETEALVEEALAREQWSPAQWSSWRNERCEFILHRAATTVPYYREHWASKSPRGLSPHRLEDWPLLEKTTLRENPRRFVAADCRTRSMFHEHTSGTSGSPVDLWWSRDTVRQWYALFEARWRRWYGVSRNDRWAILGGQLVTPVAQNRPPFWVWNSSLNQLYLSSYHLAPASVPQYLDAIQQHRVEYLWGYTSAIYSLAEEAIRLKRQVPLRVVITNAEPVHPYQRAAIAEAFACPVRETYGMAEIVAAASECAEGRLHLWPEVGVLEITPDDSVNPAVRSGRLVCTGLANVDMPLIRYVVGDHATIPAAETPCPCGRTLPTLLSVDGRDDDIIVSRDGRSIGRLDPVFKAALPIREAQVIQESVEHVRVLYVPAPGFGPAAARQLADALRERLGTIDITLEAVDQVPRASNGKFRAVICKVPRPSARRPE
jgi:phenylacetate-CoA ligase